MDNNNQEQNGFTYTYSAKEQAELKHIRDKYTAPTEDEDKMARLRRLDASVTNTAQAVALVFGVIGTLILGFGMSLIMTELGNILGLSKDTAMVIGIIFGIVGGVDERGCAVIEQRNKFCVGDIIEIMKPDGRNIEAKVLRILNEDGQEQESAPHPKQKLFIELEGEAAPEEFDILRCKG